MSEADRLIDLFERTHGGDPWHGSSIRAVLDGVDAAGAAAHPVPGAHSIWEIVLHMTGWRGEVIRRLEGHEAAEPARGDWPAPPPPTDANWRAALDALDASHRAVVAAIRAHAAQDLDQPVRDHRNPPLGTGMSFAGTLHGLVHHDVYHEGQIALLKKALASAK
jgi:uncharacterized damage-inducible protein DinB